SRSCSDLVKMTSPFWHGVGGCRRHGPVWCGAPCVDSRGSALSQLPKQVVISLRDVPLQRSLSMQDPYLRTLYFTDSILPERRILFNRMHTQEKVRKVLASRRLRSRGPDTVCAVSDYAGSGFPGSIGRRWFASHSPAAMMIRTRPVATNVVRSPKAAASVEPASGPRNPPTDAKVFVRPKTVPRNRSSLMFAISALAE